MNKCKGCEWHNKPYWSIINPCENCPREETNVEIIMSDPTIEVKELKKRIKRAIKYLKKKWKQPEWWDTDFMICIDILEGGSGNLAEIFERMR